MFPDVLETRDHAQCRSETSGNIQIVNENTTDTNMCDADDCQLANERITARTGFDVGNIQITKERAMNRDMFGNEAVTMRTNTS